MYEMVSTREDMRIEKCRMCGKLIKTDNSFQNGATDYDKSCCISCNIIASNSNNL